MKLRIDLCFIFKIYFFFPFTRRIRKRYRTMKEEDPDLPAILPLPLYAALPPNEQIRVFEPAPKYTRKVVISTNIAETSVTVDGIVYVVDAGYVKQVKTKKKKNTHASILIQFLFFTSHI